MTSTIMGKSTAVPRKRNMIKVRRAVTLDDSVVATVRMHKGISSFSAFVNNVLRGTLGLDVPDGSKFKK